MDVSARPTDRTPVISLRDVTLCYGGRTIQRRLSFDVRGGSVFAIMGASDAVDSEDILQRDGDVLKRSSTGRWVSRLSLLATELVTSRLAMRAPDALVTDQWSAQAPNYRVSIHIARLDVTSNGRASLDADWQIVARNPRRRPIRGRAQIQLAGPTVTDQDVVRLETALFDRLADSIDIPPSSRS